MQHTNNSPSNPKLTYVNWTPKMGLDTLDLKTMSFENLDYVRTQLNKYEDQLASAYMALRFNSKGTKRNHNMGATILNVQRDLETVNQRITQLDTAHSNIS